ncbi:hypothetical protein IE53DRAFT_368306 [Violaceomyces palustris]|uniref:Uncharacterized protein n=1 Tax=Violaceomyces palustris TaxID=1673888 RepID=A0ACD0NZB9_9BASI|nr:hypothetical protein IE53DRAFT_368306 [Violaceomyces palustris]
MGSSYDDPVYARTSFLHRVGSEGFGLAQHSQPPKYRLSSRTDNFDLWNASWVNALSADNFSGSDEDSSDVSDGESTRRVPRSLKPSSSSAAHRGLSRASQSTVKAATSAPVTPRKAESKPRARAARQQVAPSNPSKGKETRDRRHHRAMSAPQPLQPAQPLSINTAQPLRLPPLSICARSPLSYPTDICDEIEDGSLSHDHSTDYPAKEVVDHASSTATDPCPNFSNSSGSFGSSSSASISSIEFSESDGSCHGDAGDVDPESQLATEIIRLRESRKAEARASAARPVREENVKECGLTLSTYDYEEDLDDFDSDGSQEAAIRQHADSFVIRMAEALLDLGSMTLPSQASSRSSSFAAEEDDDGQGYFKQPRATSTPGQLRLETQRMQHRRESIQSAKSSCSGSSHRQIGRQQYRGSVAGSSRNPSELSRSSSSYLSLPSLLSPTASLKSLASSAFSSMPTSPASELEDSPDEDEPKSFGMHSRQDSGYGLNTYADEPSAFCDPSTVGVNEITTIRSRQAKAHRSASLSMGMTPVRYDTHNKDRPEVVSPLWREDGSDVTSDSTSARSWTSFFRF